MDKDRSDAERLYYRSLMFYCSTALRLRASLAGRSRHEAQGSAKVVGVRIPNSAEDTHLSAS